MSGKYCMQVKRCFLATVIFIAYFSIQADAKIDPATAVGVWLFKVRVGNRL